MATHTDGQTAGFGDFEKRIFEFMGALDDIGVKITEKSPLERACYDAMRVHMMYVNPGTQDPHEDIPQTFRPILGVWTLIEKTLRLRSKDGFDSFRAHYQLLNDGVAWQNEKYVVGDQAADKLFELIFGLSVLAIGTDLDVDDPVHSAGGKKSDILATIDGDRWGFACKVIRGSDSGQTLAKNILKAVDQIQKSDATVGIPVINVANLLPHDFFWPMLNRHEWAHEGQEPRYFA